MFRILRFLYSILYSIALALILPLLAYRVFFQKKRGLRLRERMGRIPDALLDLDKAGRPRIWIHAVSVGEVTGVQPLVHELADSYEVLISTTTETGQSLAMQLFGDFAPVFFFPLDWKWVCKRYLNQISPKALLLVESEFWPRMMQAAEETGIPVVLINGRISDKSFPRYQKLRFFFKPLLNQFRKCCMQSRQDKTRVLDLGVDEERVHLVGNIKYDYELAEAPDKSAFVRTLRQAYEEAEDAPLIWVCGSTRDAEEELLLPVFHRLAGDFPQLKWIIAPRHPHRAGVIGQLLGSHRIGYLRRSSITPQSLSTVSDRGAPPGILPPVVILDSIGELAYLYQIADVVYMGGSLVPWGGHNVIEAAYFGKPILFGPHMMNFQEIAETFLDNYAALQIRDPDELYGRLRELLRDAKARQWLGRNARKVIRDNQGALERTVEIVSNCVLNERDGTSDRSTI